MLLSIAWRNIWRSKTRSFLVIGAVIMGIWALIFMESFMRGMVISYIDNAIQFETSHIQIHHPEYKKEKELQYVIPNAGKLQNNLENQPDIEMFSSRLLVQSMISSPKAARGVIVKGVEIENEKKLTKLDTKILEGDFLESDRKNPIVISKRTADKLKVKIRSKVVVTFQDEEKNIVAGAFRIVGIYETSNRKVDEMTVYAKKEDLLKLAHLPQNTVHEIALRINNLENVEGVRDQIQAWHSELIVETFEEIAPDLELYSSQLNISLIIMTTIIMLALIFGIINTMLMAVLERIRELGMLMAIGMNKFRVFGMIVIETIIVASIGAPIGMWIGHMTVRYLNRVGIDLSRWSSGLAEFGMDNIVRPEIDAGAYVIIAMGIVITALLGSIYPSIKAITLKPVEALRTI
jgi:ABC-type lipoprotein release transport system permease subunit